MAEPRITVAPPVRRPRTGGLLSVVEVRDNVVGLTASTNAQYVSEPCEMDFNDAGFCYSAAPGDNPKTYTGITDGVSVIPNFAMYYGVECFLGPDNDFDRRARDAFGQLESRYVEEKLNVWLQAGVPVVGTTLTAAIAQADNDADLQYIGQPVIHMNRGDVVLAVAADALTVDDDGFIWTPNGNPVVSSSIYTAGSIVVTGGITVLRSPLVEVETEALTTNVAQAIAERAFGVIVDCGYRLEITFTP